MDHEISGELFKKYMDGALDKKDAAEFEDHVLHCTNCEGRYADYVKMKRGLSLVGDEPLPVGFKNEWTQRVYNVQSIHTRNAPKHRLRFLPAIASGVAAIVIVSAVLLSGVMSSGGRMAESQLAGAAENPAAGSLKQEKSMDASSENEATLPSENASLFMAQEAPAEDQAPEMSDTNSVAADKISIPLYVTSATFDALVNALEDQQIVFCLDENLIIFSITEDNQEFFAKFSEKYDLMVTPVPGETYEIWLNG